jgi:lactate permease
VGGFGVPVAVIAPILVGLGFSPMAAVVIPSVGHSWAVTFGSLGSSFQALLAATGLPEEVLGPPSAFFLGVMALFVGPMVAHISGGWQSLRRLLVPALLIGVFMAVTQYLVVSVGVWNIGGFMGGLAGLVISIPLARRYRGEERDNGILNRGALLIALSGYAVMVAITLIVQLIPPVRETLGAFVIQVQFPETVTSLGYVTPAAPGRSIPLFRHAGAILTYSAIVAYLIYRSAGLYQPGSIPRILNGTLRKVMSSSVGIASMVAMAKIMQHAGMTDTLARGLAEGMGQLFPAAAPWIGALGAFMTGSNTNSNVLFGQLQLRTAQLLGFSAAIILAAQTTGGAIGSVIAPTKVVVGASTAGVEGREGEVMRKLLIYTGLLILIASLLSLAGVLLVGGGS